MARWNRELAMLLDYLNGFAYVCGLLEFGSDDPYCTEAQLDAYISSMVLSWRPRYDSTGWLLQG